MWMEAFSDPFSAPVDGTVLGVGLDLVRMDRAARLLEVHGEALLRRILHGNDGTGEEPRLPPDHLAAMLAAKEACFKALGPGVAEAWDWPQVEVCVTKAVFLVFRGAAREAALKRGVTRILSSVGSMADVSFAVVILWRDSHGR